MRLASLAMGGAVEGAVLLEDGSARLLGKSVAETIAEAAAGATLGDLSDLPQVAPAAVALVAPIPVPAKNVFCVGRNYMEHIAEGERAQNTKVGVTEVPVFFTKPP
ncbi:MAG: hydrolase, partial [Pseudomonadota bacterium]